MRIEKHLYKRQIVAAFKKILTPFKRGVDADPGVAAKSLK